ncbi:MutS protein 1 [Coemansia helicoidea]|uniref:MutS protein 1 n=1 Tax=Coemansia helicoidea TaxID=1286919 RepID=A0ACC1L5C8_9FUNG|nr:MutS protein 1 [Coemansia helicoidea]
MARPGGSAWTALARRGVLQCGAGRWSRGVQGSRRGVSTAVDEVEPQGGGGEDSGGAVAGRRPDLGTLDADSEVFAQAISSSSVLTTVRECRQQYPGSVLLVRVGDFYELYFEQADEVGGAVLGLQVVDKKFRSGTVRFTGFPARSLLRYVEILVARHGLSVALCEQFQEPMRRSFTRKVTRVITPGTLIDESCLDDIGVHNYILCIADASAPVAPRAEAQVRRRRGRPRKSPDSTPPSEADAGDAVADEVPLCLAWLDLATGSFMASTSSSAGLSADLARIRPREILVSDSDARVQSLVASMFPAHAPGRPAVARVPAASFAQYMAAQPADSGALAGPLNPNSQYPMAAPALGASPDRLLAAAELADGERAAACALLSYVAATQLGLLPPLQPPRRYSAESHMRMSAATMDALELVRPAGGAGASATTTLLGEINLTRTSAGSRLLATRLTAPSTSADIIEQRLDLVEFFSAAPRVRELIRARLANVGDIERAVNKLSLNCGGPHDLLEIARSLREVAHIKQALDDHVDAASRPPDAAASVAAGRPRRQRPTASAASHRKRPEMAAIVRRHAQALQALPGLVRDIGDRIRSDAERDVRAFGFLKPNCNEQITQLHAQLAAKHQERQQLQQQWQAAYACASLRLDSMPALGHFIEVARRDAARLQESGAFRMVQTLKSRVRFENAQWTHLLSEIELLRARLCAEEMRAFEELRDRVLEASATIRTNSRVLANVDVAISMAIVAITRQYTRPRLAPDDGSAPDHTIAGGRHPVIETQLLGSGRQFVSNDCAFSAADGRVLLLTGPNMGGKSTYLRQIALTSILAQMGGFVPADSARLDIADAIYSRIGARDNLALDQSTFMVEMVETAHILTRATARSLVILDEIGRGTATADGVAIAYATLKYLHDTVRCKAVFATHYHELVPHVVPALPALRTLHTAVHEDGRGGFAFLHKVRPGVYSKSHALYVAQIAGVPKPVLAMARDFAAAGLVRPSH